jgi:hypothetical protein
MKLEFSQEIVEKYANTEFHENPSSGGRRTDGGQTDKTKINGGFS